MTSAVSPKPAMSLEARLQDARVRILYDRNLQPALSITPFAALVCWFIWGQVPSETILAWLGLKAAVSVAFIVVDRAYRRFADPADAFRWGAGYLVLLALDGGTWSLMGTMLTPMDRLDIVAIMFASVVGVGAVGGVNLAAHFPASVAFTTTLLVPVLVWHISHATPVALFAAGGTAVYLALILLNGFRTAQSTTELLRLRFRMDEVAEQRAEALRHAERQSAVKSQFLATMSHEMRTPLHGMLGTLRLLRDNPKVADGLPQLDLIERAGEHLLGLINDVLDFSRIEAGRLEVRSAPFDVAALLRDAVELSSSAAAEKHLELHLDAGLPVPAWMPGDAPRVRQVVLNLMGNAIKFTEHGAVTVSARIVDGRLRIDVRDSGIGISPEDLTRVFDPFQQVDSSYARRYAGTGLGLSISRELARTMGGDLVCESAPGQGSVFTFELPWKPCPAPEVVPDVVVSEPARPLAGRVLLADDNPVNVLVAKGMLEALGLDVTVATDGVQAVASYLDARPVVVLMDCHMPQMDGYEATRRIRDAEVRNGWPRVPVIAVTANALEDDRKRCLDAGMDDHLAKPFRKEDLRVRLEPYFRQG